MRLVIDFHLSPTQPVSYHKRHRLRDAGAVEERTRGQADVQASVMQAQRVAAWARVWSSSPSNYVRKNITSAFEKTVILEYIYRCPKTHSL